MPSWVRESVSASRRLVSVARWLSEVQPVVPREDGHYVGEPLVVTTNDYEVGLYNGDTGVVVQ